MKPVLLLFIALLALALPATATTKADKEVNLRGDFVGSDECAKCHQSVYDEWKDTRHATVLRKLYTKENHRIEAPWGTEKEPKTATLVSGQKITTFMKGDKYWVTMHDAKDPSRDISRRIDAVGYKSQTNFMSWDEENNSLSYLPFTYWRDDNTGEHWGNFFYFLYWQPDGSFFPEEKLKDNINFLGYENRCADCHVTGFYAKSWEELPDIGRVVDEHNLWTTTEFRIGCEKCHGPGGTHVKSLNRKDIVNPENLAEENQADDCHQCHQSGYSSNYTAPHLNPYINENAVIFDEDNPLGPGDHFNVGENLEDYYTSFLRYQWAGTEYFQQGKSSAMQLASSKHGKAGINCKTCHDPHTQKTRKLTNDLCLDCHTDKGTAEHQMEAHKMMDVSCVDCHMPFMIGSRVRSVRYDNRSHHFDVLTPTDSLEQFDYLKQFTEPDADPENRQTKFWQKINENGACYDSWKYPSNMFWCTSFDVLPNACSSCHHSEFPLPGKFDDEQRNKLLRGQERYNKFLKATTK
ncbi:multiheme c-type cytochrome [Desulfuromusa kysingii]|nr:multiheme c-type cytochrome [Desulfuromusa kysingii]